MSSRRAFALSVVAGTIVGCVIGFGLASPGLMAACQRAFDGHSPPWRMYVSEESCVSLVDPYVAESNTLELSTPPSLLSDPREAVRLLGPALRALDPDIGGVATVRFQLTGEGNVRDRRIVEGSGHEALDEAIATIADAFEFSPGTTVSGATEVPMEYVVGFQTERRARLLRWLDAIGD